MGSDSGKWQLAVWLMTGLFTLWCGGMTQAMISNDRIRATEDQKIVEVQNSFQKEVIQRLTRIETKLDKN